MELGDYKIGSISEAIKVSSETDGNDDRNDEEILKNLFSFQPVYNQQNDGDQQEATVDDEMLQQYINPSEEESLPKVKNPPRRSATKKETDGIDKAKKKKKLKEHPERKARTLFVGNVAVSVKKKTLLKMFKQFGEVETIRIRSVPTADPKTNRKVAYIKKEFHPDRKSLNAYVVFKQKEDAQKALKCNGMILEDLHLRVDLSNNTNHDTSRSLFVGNLPFNTEEDELRNHFKQSGEITDVRIIRDKKTGVGKGFAYVKYEDKSDIMFGLKLNGSEFKGRKLRVFQAMEQNKIDGRNKMKQTNKSFRGLRADSTKDLKAGKHIFNFNANNKNKKSNNRANSLKRIKEKKAKQNTKAKKLKKIEKKERSERKKKSQS